MVISQEVILVYFKSMGKGTVAVRTRVYMYIYIQYGEDCHKIPGWSPIRELVKPADVRLQHMIVNEAIASTVPHQTISMVLFLNTRTMYKY